MYLNADQFNKRKNEGLDTAKMEVTFLGTCSGGGPTESRNCSSLVLDMLSDYDLWMVDCAEGTVRQFAQQPHVHGQRPLKISRVTKVFITHMHADHVMGLITLLRNLLYNTKVVAYPGEVRTEERVVIFGPAGLRTFVRQNLKLTLTRAVDRYVVHELLTADDPITPCEPIPEGSTTFHPTELNIMHCCELPGLDIRAGPDGLWRAVTEGHGRMSKILVDAGPILHRDPCIGYVFQEAWYPSRKVVILGDTYDPEPMIPLCINPSPSLLIHEATDSHISATADTEGKLSKRSAETVLQAALSKGHSVPEMAGAFAKKVNASGLVLNHIGARFPAPRNPSDDHRKRIMRDILKKANLAWGHKKNYAVAAFDFCRVNVPIDPDIKEHPRRHEISTTGAKEKEKEKEKEAARRPPPPEIIGNANFSRSYQYYEDRGVERISVNAVASTSQAVHTPAGGGSEFIEWDLSGHNSKKRRGR